MLLSGFGFVLFLIGLFLLVFGVVALVIASTTREDAYRATGKRTKKFWVGILSAVVAVNVLPIIGFSLPLMTMLQIAGLVGTIVFMVDVRPATRAITGGGGGRIRGWRRGRPGGGGSSSDGPYGPYNGRR
ncbi:DUF2516 family protein [Streptomyces montanisoli]|uniref:DUF2516 family protein n=1 Tax=Streptomyces montanisoli TaxID=2798581 RepID=A0A940RVS0_9ACTN|nr:DUF2516 family protein [Streptomyces montanisoli]MBP0459352.1 DUF2516 family protein [Streptomyces montanisoli]